MRYLLFGCLLFFNWGAYAALQETDLGGRHVYYWSPASEKPAPILIFSHGFGGCGDQTRFLMEQLAAAGYWVFAPNHADALCHTNRTRSLPATSFDQPFAWHDKTYSDRRDDIVAVLQALKNSPKFKNKIDFTKLGLIGHSLGGYTVMGLAGGWSSWQQPGIKAVLAMSPYAMPFWLQGKLGQIKAPVMLQGGTRDLDITPYLNRFLGIYALAPAPKYYVEFTGADHYAWTNDGSVQKDLTEAQLQAQQTAITAYSRAFLDYYVKGNAPSEILTHLSAGISEQRYQSELGTGHIDQKSFSK